MKRFNVNDAAPEVDADEPAGFRIATAGIQTAIGAENIAANLFVLPPGEAVCPYHWESDEEWLMVLAGHPLVRHASGEDTLAPGDVVCFPAGPDGAHKVSAGDDEARVIILSTRNMPAVCGYPDSGKIGVWNAGGRVGMFREADSVGYYDGETG